MARKVLNITEGKPVIEGAGVKLSRIFAEPKRYDPFLLLDHFGSDNKEDYIKGFPLHPHRGIITVTYMKKGEVEHSDSLKNIGIIKPGETQWMTAGSGIIHQEMPKPIKGEMMGFQLWINLPRKDKMIRPAYKEIKDLKNITKDDARIKIISDSSVEYLDIELNGSLNHKTKKKTAFIYVYEGNINIEEKTVNKNELALLEKEGDIKITGTAKFLLIAGDPLNEPVAWGGPIVMNTEEELQLAFFEIQNSTFIK